MKLTYEDLISGDIINIDGIGHLKSPFLWELQPTKGIGMWTYNLYLNVLTWEKEDFLRFISATDKFGGTRVEKIKNNEKLTIFDSIVLIDFSRELLRKTMAFFINEKLEWDCKNYCFYTRSNDNNEIIGKIDRTNFEQVRDLMLQLNYINVGDSAKPISYASDTSKQLWEKAQKYLKEEAKTKTPDKRLSIGNIVSKLSAGSNTYNLLNIYNLTVFQLYDQFFQYGYLRATELNERAFSIHGGKNFDMQAWLKPILKN